MAKTSERIQVGISPAATWAAATDLDRYSEWLTLHDGWRSPVPRPSEITTGTTVSSVVIAKGTRVRFDWVIATFVEGREIALRGSGKGGIKAKLDLAVAPSGAGSTITFTLELGGLPMMGPLGKAAVMAVAGDLRESLAAFDRVFGS
ncbi:MAG: SRPBCC family protein [Gordonia sp. (in: high G+C Gram-positive bacteria)]